MVMKICSKVNSEANFLLLESLELSKRLYCMLNGAIHRNTTFDLSIRQHLLERSTIPITTCDYQSLGEPPVTVKGYKNNVPLTLIYPWIGRRVSRKLHQWHDNIREKLCQAYYVNVSNYYHVIGVGTKYFGTRCYDQVIRR